MRFAKIMLLTGIRRSFTYGVPDCYASHDLVGYRVIVPFRNGLEAGVVIEVDSEHPRYKVRWLLSVPDARPLVDGKQLSFMRWVASYYLCSLEEVIWIALGNLRRFIEPRLAVNSGFEGWDEVLRRVGEGEDVSEEFIPLLEGGVVSLADDLREHLPREVQVRLCNRYMGAEGMVDLREVLGGWVKQEGVVDAYLRLVEGGCGRWVSRGDLLGEGVSRYSLKTLLSKGIFVERRVFVSGYSLLGKELCVVGEDEGLGGYVGAIERRWLSHRVVLLWGGGSGALRRLCLEVVARGMRDGVVLYLVPTIKEVRLCVPEFDRLFGGCYGVYHGECTAVERLRVRDALEEGRLRLVVGTRSALFLPFKNLVRVVVTEEGSEGYGQVVRGPSYHVRNAGIVLAREYGARVLLSGVAPSLASYYNVCSGKYGGVRVVEGGVVSRIRMVRLRGRGALSGRGYRVSPAVLSLVKRSLDAGEQVVVIHNRRGYATYVRCEDCSWFPKCLRCEGRLVYHEVGCKFRCHACGYVANFSSSCGRCSSSRLRYIKMGTQQVEELLGLYLPDVRIGRIDGDVVGGSANYLRALDDFRSGGVDVLVATPSIVNVLPAIGVHPLVVMLGVEDWFGGGFSAHEKVCQSLIRLSEGGVSSGVVVQVGGYVDGSLVDLIRRIIRGEVRGVYDGLLAERRSYGYPPYVRFVRVSFMGKDRDRVVGFAEGCAELYGDELGLDVLGPSAVRRFGSLYKQVLWLKLGRGAEGERLKARAYELTGAFLKRVKVTSGRFIFDVDVV